MLTTLVLAAGMAAPSTVEPVNFVHGYKEKDKLTYAMTIEAGEMGMEASMTFDLTVGATKDGKTNVTISFVEADTGGFGEMVDTEPVQMNIDKNGIPLMDEQQNNDMIMIALMSTYLPNKKLDEGGTFEFKRENDEVKLAGKGKFTGMEKVDGTSYAVLESETLATPPAGGEVTLEVKTYYNPLNKRVERTYAALVTDGGEFKVALKMKK